MEIQNQSDMIMVSPLVVQEVLLEFGLVPLHHFTCLSLYVIVIQQEYHSYVNLPSLEVGVLSTHHPSFCVNNSTWLDLKRHSPFRQL